MLIIKFTQIYNILFMYANIFIKKIGVGPDSGPDP